MNLGLVTTAKGHARFLPELLASIEAQTVRFDAHACVSDGDPECAAIFEKYVARDPKRRVHYNRCESGGPAVAWNAGIRALPASIDWCIKIDADDVADPTLVAEIKAALSGARDRLDVIVPAHWHFGDPTDKPHTWVFPKWSPAAHLESCCAPAQSAFRRPLWDLVGGFDETIPSAEDWEFFTRVATVQPTLRVHTLKKALWGYRQHGAHRASAPFHEQQGAYQAYAKGHTRESVLAKSRCWAEYCDELKHGRAPWLTKRSEIVVRTTRNDAFPHFYQDIEGSFWYKAAYERIFHDLPSDKPSLWVEVGTFHGQSLSWLGVEAINTGKPVTIIGVDNFAGWPGVAQGETLRNSFENNVAPLRAVLHDQFRWIVGGSVQTAAQFEDHTIDVVWLDADHSFEAVKADIAAWWPKVKLGGLIGGDDWAYGHGVRDAVDLMFPQGYELMPGTNNGSSWPSWVVRKPLLPQL